MVSDRPSPVALPRRQAQRLRHYFGRGGRATAYDLDGIDLDLIGTGLIRAEASDYAGNRITVTDLGAKVLHEHRQADITSRAVHHTLGERLAAWLREQGRITWENVEFHNTVPVEQAGDVAICVRPDVYSIKPSLRAIYSNPCVHEVKVSRADFLGDLAKPQKRAAYAMMAEAVYYVAPEGVIQPNEVPKGFGLLVERTEGTFVLARRARRNKIQLQPQHYLAMIVKPGRYPQGYRGGVEVDAIQQG